MGYDKKEKERGVWEEERRLQRRGKIIFFLLLRGLEQHSVALGGGEGKGKRKVEISTYLCQRMNRQRERRSRKRYRKANMLQALDIN